MQWTRNTDAAPDPCTPLRFWNNAGLAATPVCIPVCCGMRRSHAFPAAFA